MLSSLTLDWTLLDKFLHAFFAGLSFFASLGVDIYQCFWDDMKEMIDFDYSLNEAL